MAVACGIPAFGRVASAATYTWNGGAGTWTTAGAWSGSTWANGNDALFVGTGGTVAATSGGTATGITFGATAGAYTLSLNTNFLIGSGGVTANQDATIAQSNFIFPIVASSTQTWTVASGKTLTMDFGASAARVNNGAGTVLTKAGDGTLALKASFSGSPFAIFSGNTFRVTAGKVTYQTPSANFSNAGTFVMTGGEMVMGTGGAWGDLGGVDGTWSLDGGVLSGVRRFFGSGTATFNFNGGTIRSGTGASDFFASAATLNVKAGGAIFDTNGFDVTIFRQFSEDPTSTGGGLTKQGAGTLTLGFSGTLGYTGETRVEGGVLTLNANPRLASTRLNVVSGTFDYSAAGATAVPTLTRLAGGGTILAPAGATITVGSSGTFAPGDVTLGTLAITTSSGTANLSLNAASTTTIRLGSPGTSYSSPGSSDRVTLSGSLGLGGTINLVNDGNAAGGTYRVATFGTSGGSATIGTNVAGTRAKLSNQGSGTAAGKGLFLDVYNLASGSVASGTSVSLGVIHAGGAFGTQTLTIANASVAGSYTEGLNASFSGTSGDASAGGSAITNLAGGGTSTSLTVGLGNANTGVAGTKSGSLTIGYASSGTLGGFSNQDVGLQAIAVTGSVFSGTASWGLGTGGAWGSEANANWSSAEGVAAAPGTFAGYTNVDAATFGSAVTGGTAAISLNGAQVSLASLVFSNTATRYVLQSGTGSGSFTLAAAAGMPQVNVAGTHEIAVGIAGSAGLQKTGAGALILSGSNGYSGGTDVTTGSLFVNGFVGGSFSVASGAMLGGAGSIGGLATVSGTLSPGNSPGELTLASLVLTSTATTLIEIQGLTRGSQYDGITITDANGITYGGSLLFDFTSLVADNTMFDIFSFGGSSSGSFGSVASTGAYAGTWTNNNDGTYSFAQGSQTLTFSQSTGDIVVVPEPQAVALALCGIGAAGFRLLKRRRR